MDPEEELLEGVKSPLLGNASVGKPPLVPSSVFALLLTSAAVFLVSHVVLGFLFFSKLQNAIQGLSWLAVFLPAWVGIALAILFQLIALCLLVVPIRWVLTVPPTEQAVLDGYPEYLLPVLRGIVSWTLFAPLLGFLPTVPLLAPLLAFEVQAYQHLQTPQGGVSGIAVVTPLWVLLGLVWLAVLCVRRRHDWWRVGNLVVLTVLLVLVVVKGNGGGGMSWWVIGIPIWVWLVVVLFLLCGIAVEASRGEGSVALRDSQRMAVILYGFAWLATAVASVLVCGQLEGVGDTLWFPEVGLVVCCGAIAFGLGYMVVAQEYLADVRVNGMTVESQLEASWGVEVVEEEWPLLGVVERRRVPNFVMQRWSGGGGVEELVKFEEEEVEEFAEI